MSVTNTKLWDRYYKPVQAGGWSFQQALRLVTGHPQTGQDVRITHRRLIEGNCVIKMMFLATVLLQSVTLSSSLFHYELPDKSRIQIRKLAQNRSIEVIRFDVDQSKRWRREFSGYFGNACVLSLERESSMIVLSTYGGSSKGFSLNVLDLNAGRQLLSGTCVNLLNSWMPSINLDQNLSISWVDFDSGRKRIGVYNTKSKEFSIQTLANS